MTQRRALSAVREQSAENFAAGQYVLNYPTLTKGVYYKDHRRLVLEYWLWYALTTETWDSSTTEPTRVREHRHYLEAMGIL